MVHATVFVTKHPLFSHNTYVCELSEPVGSAEWIIGAFDIVTVDGELEPAFISTNLLIISNIIILIV